MMSRRSFLVGAGAGLIAPRMLDTLSRHLKAHGRPLILAPKNPSITLYVERDDDHLIHMWRMDRRTWRQLGLKGRDMTYPSRDQLVRATADLLKSLDLGSLCNQPDKVGGIRFERPRYRMGCGEFAYCDDLLSVSLLQARLNETGTGLKVDWV